MRTVLIVFFCCVTIASAQQGNMPTDTAVSMQKKFVGEIIVGGGYGEGGSLLLGVRLYYFSPCAQSIGCKK